MIEWIKFKRKDKPKRRQNGDTMAIKTRQVLGYAFLPRIIPMIRDLLRPGFGLIAQSMAQIYAACGLLPRNHAYLNAVNLGRFSVSHVVLEAARNLQFKRNHLDQIFIFALLLAGLVLLVVQFCITGFIMFTQAAHAAIPTSWGGFFTTAAPEQDIAYMLMDRVFGIPGMFNSCASTAKKCLNDPNIEIWPLPYHVALHNLLAFYSMGIAVVGLVIFMYYIVTVILETAESGTPFGRRFNHVWAPIRMVVALGLLIPFSSGMNGAQLLTLNIAKAGSSFATNGWNIFVADLSSPGSSASLLDSSGNLIATPKRPGPSALFQFYTVVSTCTKMYAYHGVEINAWLVKNVPGGFSSAKLLDTSWSDANSFYDNNDILVVFGEQDALKYPEEKGRVKPWCGQIVLPATDVTHPGATKIQEAYYNSILRRFWQNAYDGSVDIVGSSTGAPGSTGVPLLSNGREQNFFYNAANRIIEGSKGIIPGITDKTTGVPASTAPYKSDKDAKFPNGFSRTAMVGQWNTDMDIAVQEAVTEADKTKWLDTLGANGWAGAGIWYNKIAEINGGLTSAITALPTVRKWPMVMEEVATQAAKVEKDRSDINRFVPYYSNSDNEFTLPPEYNFDTAQALSQAYLVWYSLVGKELTGIYAQPVRSTKNVLIDFLQGLFGTTGLFSMRDNTNIHPLAQIVVLGKNLLDSAIFNLGAGVVTQVAGSRIFEGIPEQMTDLIGKFLTSIGMMTMVIGATLYYVVPFLPFIYFFFQVAGWIKGLFEAMVGLPLWALAHIRIDGEGLPGNAAMQGYHLIFELFLRPILTIFGLVGSVVIFAAQVQVLNGIFGLVISNLTGFDQNAAALPGATADTVGWYGYFRGYVDQLFFTVIYAVIVYMMGTASFKLIYMIPDKTLRWMGANIESFGDELGKTGGAEHLVGRMYGGMSAVSSQVDSGILKPNGLK